MSTKADPAERERRYKRAREAMAKAGLKGVLIASMAGKQRGYVRYFADYQVSGHDALLLIPLEGEPAMTFSSYLRARQVAERGWVTDVRGGFNAYDAKVVPKIIDAMRERGLTRGRVGIAGLEWIMPYGTYQKLHNALPGVEFVNADELMDRLRMVKSPLEIQQIREVHRAVRGAFERFLEVLEPGKTEAEVCAEATKAALAGGASASATICEGGFFDIIHGPRNVPIKGEGILRLYLPATGAGGHGTEQLLTCAFREPTRLEARMMESEVRAYEEARKLRPGVRLSDMSQTYEDVLREDGWEFGELRTGYDFHAIGMDGVERPCYAEVMKEEPELWHEVQDWKLEAGTVINYHPRRNVTAFTKEDRTNELNGAGVDEDILITPNGSERLLGDDWDPRWRRMDR